MFRLLSFFFKPFSRKLKNKTRSSLFKPMIFAFKVIAGFIVLSLLIVICVEVMSSVNPNAGDKVTIKRVKSETTDGLYENNSDGTVNGLNLLLINNIKTEGYVKEILSMYRDSTENKLDDYEFQVPVEVKLGIQADETGLYTGTLLPKSYLPTKDGVVVWKESFDGIPAEEMTVQNLSPDNAMSLVNRYPNIYGQMSYNVGTTSYQGLYQNVAGSEVNGFPASKLNWLGSSSGRGARTYYQPDGISYLNGRLNRFMNDYFNDTEKAKFKENLAMASITVPGTHNAGEAGFMIPLTYGYRWDYGASFTSESGYMAVESLYNDLKSSYTKYPILAKKYYGHAGRAIGAYLLCEAGWSFSQVGYDYIISYGNITDEISADLLGEGKTSSDMINYFKSKIGSLPSDVNPTLYNWSSNSSGWVYYQSTPKGFMFKYDSTKTVTRPNGTTVPFLSVMNNETLGQIYSALFQGSYIYAVALKYAGVDVDPTDPNTYMNNIPDGEWKPSGDTAWMDTYGIKPSEIGEKRTAILNEAYKWLGSWYTWGGTGPPEKDANGDWIMDSDWGKGFDCSSYTQYVINQALGIDISRTTYSQINNSNLETISESEAKPGDLIYYYYDGDYNTEHVSIFVGKDSATGKDIIMHAPYKGKVLCLVVWDGTMVGSPNTKRVFKRVKGLT